MKYSLVVIVWLCIIVGGCASHYYQINGSEMVMVLTKSDAHRVDLACSLDAYQPHSAKKKAGRWEVLLPSNKAFRYFYRVDGMPFVPDCPMKENDDFGSETCIFDPQL